MDNKKDKIREITQVDAEEKVDTAQKGTSIDTAETVETATLNHSADVDEDNASDLTHVDSSESTDADTANTNNSSNTDISESKDLNTDSIEEDKTVLSDKPTGQKSPTLEQSEEIEKASAVVVDNGEEKTPEDDEKAPGDEHVEVDSVVEELTGEEQFVELDKDKAEDNQEPDKDEVDKETTEPQATDVEGELVLHEKDKPKPTTEKEKVKKDSKFKLFLKKNKLLLIIVLAAVLIAASGVVTYFVLTKDMVFVRSIEDITNATKGNLLVFKSDVVADQDISIENYSINLNKYTLTVNGDLAISGKDTVNIGKKKGKEFIQGGTVIANTITVNGKALVLRSKTVTDALVINTTNVELFGDIQPREQDLCLVSISNNSVDAIFYSTLIGDIKLSSNAGLSFYGKANQISGGTLVTAYNDSVADMIQDTQKVILYPNSKVDNLHNINDFVYIQYLTPPELLILKEDNKFVCYVSKVNNADYYDYNIDGQTGRLEGTESSFELPELSPGVYSLSVTAGSTNESYNSQQATKTVNVQYSVKLSKPAISVVKEEDAIMLNIGSVANATEYIYTINGKEYASTSSTKIDITDKVSEIGSYTVLVYAKNSKDSSYELSDKTMATYTKTQKLIIDNVIVVYNEEEGNYTASWDAIEGANYYQINNNGLITYTRSTSYTFEEDEVFDIIAKGTGFYEDSSPRHVVAIED